MYPAQDVYHCVFQVVLCCFASQELRLLSHVFDTAASGDAEGVCDAIERFGEDVLNPAGQWLKVHWSGMMMMMMMMMMIMIVATKMMTTWEWIQIQGWNLNVAWHIFFDFMI